MQTDPPRARRDGDYWGQRDSNWLGGKNWFK
jgi:hypothetical protein